MAVPAVLNLRSATEEDRSWLANLLHFETYVHRHLDWRQPLDWLGHDPYLILEFGNRLNAALACPPDPPGVAWICLFAAATRTAPQDAWDELWPQTLYRLRKQSVQYIAAIPLHDWFRKILIASQFEEAQHVVVLDWRAGKDDIKASAQGDFHIRPMQANDLEAVAQVDQGAFAPLWQNSLTAIQLAFKQADFATVAEADNALAAFQISTRGWRGIHLARLATHPNFQGRGFASALVWDLQARVQTRHEALLTVNTQNNNLNSLALYRKLGFRPTGEEFPVFQFDPARHPQTD